MILLLSSFWLLSLVIVVRTIFAVIIFVDRIMTMTETMITANITVITILVVSTVMEMVRMIEIFVLNTTTFMILIHQEFQ